MTYELSKQLKDAGYPQKYHPFTGLMYEENGTIPIHHSNDKGCYCPDCIGEPFCIVPTLSELIEACNKYDDFELSTAFPISDGWAAEIGYVNEDEDEFSERAKGKTPEEAVARLWLALNPATV